MGDKNLMNLNLSFSGLGLTQQSDDGLENVPGVVRPAWRRWSWLERPGHSPPCTVMYGTLVGLYADVVVPPLPALYYTHFSNVIFSNTFLSVSSAQNMVQETQFGISRIAEDHNTITIPPYQTPPVECGSHSPPLQLIFLPTIVLHCTAFKTRLFETFYCPLIERSSMLHIKYTLVLAY